MLPSNHSFSNIAIAILDFSLLLLVRLPLLILYAFFLISVLCFSLSKVIALPTIAIVIALKGDSEKSETIAVAIDGKAITIWEAMQKRSHEPIYKTQTKIFAKLEEQ